MSDKRRTSGYLPAPKVKEPPIFFFMMRFNLKVAVIFLFATGILTIVMLYSICFKIKDHDAWAQLHSSLDISSIGEEIDCDINGEYVISCRKEAEEVFVPFSFIHRYFEVYGKLAKFDGLERFEWSHSYSKIYHPKTRYDPRGVFMHFENYNVEVRDRVKCVSAVEGVPISTQWESQGYYYPTQIAQFGLSHYSKNLTEPEPRMKVLEDGDVTQAEWVVPNTASVTRKRQLNVDNVVLEFATSDNYVDGIVLNLEHVLDFVLSVDLLLYSNSSVTVVLKHREVKDVYNLHYIPANISITVQNNNVYYGIGTSPDWRKLSRDLIIDLQKGLSYIDKDKSKHKLPRSKLKIVNIILRGSGLLDNLTLSTSDHIQQFYAAAEWFVRNQDPETGGWAIPVKRKLASGFYELLPGWYSSMGQGQAISVLSRAYHHSEGDERYLKAAILGLKPFRVPSSQGGVVATFMKQYHWYEEYPTKPASFVLNGFIYSLLGLYDLMTIAPDGQTHEAEFLFNEGMNSLKNMLMLFDMGSVTSYDLRHFTIGTAPNLARWDYHATHINQLLLLSTIDNDSIFRVTAERWIGYMNGKRADHN